MRKCCVALLLLFAVQLFAGQVVTVSKNISDLATQYGWQHDKTYLSFQLDGAITVTGTTGNAKYCSDNTAKSMRYYQNTLKGEFAIQGRAGVMIQSIKLSYYYGGMVTNSWSTEGKNIPAANQVKNNETFPVNANSITLYVGATDNSTGKQVRITAIEVTYVVSGHPVVSVTTQDLATQYGWAHETCLKNFNLNNVITVDVDEDGTMKYNAETKSFHCYQWLGGFTISGSEGRTIKSVRLTYNTVNAGVLTRNWGTTGKSIAPEDQIASGEAVEVNANSVTFYVGTTDTVTNGQIRILSWEVEYKEISSVCTMLRTTTDLGKQFGWADATCPVDIPFNNALSLHSDSINNVKYYSTTRSFHCYRWCGGFYFKARKGTLIQSVALSYDPAYNGVLTQNWGVDGKNIPEADWIASGTVIMVNSDSVHFFVGDKAETASCQIHITGFTIQYIDSLSHLEKWETCSSAGSTTAVEVQGDKGLYNWQLSSFQRQAADFVGSNQGIRILYGGAVASDGVQQGGVKDLSFEWRTANNNLPVHFSVKAGSVTDEVERAATGSSNYEMNYTNELAVKSNCAFSIEVGAEETTRQDHIIVGALTITPYLLFTVPNRVDTISTEVNQYDLNKVLINNTGDEPLFEIIANTTGDTAIMNNGVVDLSQVTHAGDIAFKASWNEGQVYTTMTLHIGIPPQVYFAETDIVVNMGIEPFVNPLTAPEHIGAVSYTSSDNKVAMVNDTGLVTVKGLGQVIITAHIASSEMYVATSVSYNLSVIYTPEEGSYFEETFSQCKTSSSDDGIVYVVGDGGVYDWNFSNYSRTLVDEVAGEQGIRLNYGGSISTNGTQEGGVKYLSFDWRCEDATAPVHFMINLDKTTVSYSQAAVGDVTTVMTCSQMFNRKSNAALSIHVNAKESPVQTPVVISPLRIVPYLLFTAKSVELQLPVDTFDCASDSVLINNTNGEGTVNYSIVSSTSGKVSITGSVLDLSMITEEEEVVVKAQWGEVSTTMTVHVGIPSGIYEVQNAQCTMQSGKVMKDGELWIWKDGQWWTVLGCPRGL